MNATYNMDHLQAVAHVAAVLNTHLAVGDAAAANQPKTASTSHYDPEGKAVATVSNTSYQGVTFAADGTISGGSLSHESISPDGLKLSTTAVGFGANGKPGSAQITVHNNSGEGDFKHVQMDMSGATWNESFAISSGGINITTIDAATGKKKHDGTIKFDKEAVVSGSFTHYAPDKDGVVTGSSQVDYSGAKFLGTALVGGQYTVHHQSADNSSKSTSQITVSPLGQPQSIETTNMAPDSGAVTTKVAVDFSKITFNARNEFHAGDLLYTASDDKGNMLSQTTVTYNNAVPSLSTTLVYKGAQLQSKVVVDYSASLFNNDHRVINSSKKVEVFSGANKLVSSTIVTYDALGNKVKQEDASTAQPPKAAPPKKAVAPVPMPPPFKAFAAAGDETTQTDKKNRADGTLEQERVTTLKAGKPVAATITMYGADGKTVIKTFEMDLTGLGYDPASKTVSGALSMQSKLGGNVVHADSVIQY